LSKIVYLAFASASLTGGNKMTFRHVEALAAGGFDAVVRLMDGGKQPSWFTHTALVEDETRPLDARDILVLPEDGLEALRRFAPLANHKVVFCQNPYYATEGVGRLTSDEARPWRRFIACSAGVAAWIARYLDYDQISVVPGFADERLFRPAPKQAAIACIPRKRPMELTAIRHMFGRLYRGSTPWRWEVLENVVESDVATAMGRAAVFLSLNRFEGMSQPRSHGQRMPGHRLHRHWASGIRQPSQWHMGRGGRLRGCGQGPCADGRAGGRECRVRSPDAPRRPRYRPAVVAQRLCKRTGKVLAG
jgi:hypothetical protein